MAKTLIGQERLNAALMIERNHYAKSVPSGKSHYFDRDGVLIVFSLPANKNISSFLIGEPNAVWELSRMWAPDNHQPNALTRAIAGSVREFRILEPETKALVSYADPNVGHAGYVYRAASWLYTGASEEGRYYQDAHGQVIARRKFHSGSRALTKSEILAKGYVELRRPGKLRFARGLTKAARKKLIAKFCNS